MRKIDAEIKSLTVSKSSNEQKGDICWYGSKLQFGFFAGSTDRMTIFRDSSGKFGWRNVKIGSCVPAFGFNDN